MEITTRDNGFAPRTYPWPLARKPECSQGGVPGLVLTQPGGSDLSRWFFYYLEVVTG